MKIVVAALLILLAFHPALPDTGLDSLEQSLETLPEDTSKVIAYKKLCAGWLPVNPRKAIGYSLNGLHLSKKINYEAGIASGYINTGHAYNAIGMHDTAILYTDSALAFAQSRGDTSRLALIYINRGSIMVDMKLLGKAQEDFEKAMMFAEKSGNKDRIARAGMALGNVLYYQKQYEKAELQYKQSLQSFRQLGNNVMESILLMNAGNCSRNLKDFASAEKYYASAIELQKAGGDQLNLMTSHGNLGIMYEEMGDTAKALVNYEKAYRIATELDDKEQMALNGAYVGEQYILRGRLKEGMKLVQQAYMHSMEQGYLEERMNAASILAEGYAKEGNYRLAYLLAKEASQLNDSLASVRQDERVVRMQAELEAGKKDREIELLSKERQLQAADALRQRQLKNVFIAGAALLGILALVLLNRFQLKRKSAKELIAKNQIIEQEKKRAEESEKFKQQFLANMSHEIRTPMNAIMGMSRLLSDKKFDPESDQYIKAIRHSSENLLVIINDILDLSKLQAGKMELEKLPFSLTDQLELVCNTFRAKAREKNISIDLITDDLPEYVQGDSARFAQIMMNLVSNAVKFTDQGQILITAKSNPLGKSRHEIQFSVKDSGIGIHEKDIENIFNSFTQAEVSHSRRYGGTGLGLTIVRDLVSLHGGTLKVVSEEKKGAEFSFSINYRECKPPEAKPHSEKPDEVLAYAQAPVSILIADDNIYNTIVAADTIKKYLPAAELSFASTGKEVLSLLESGLKPDVLLLDVQMPEMDGYETSREIRKNYPELTVIALTASVINTDRQKCRDAGMDDFIAKPFTDADLLTPLLPVLKKFDSVKNNVIVSAEAEEDKYKKLFLDLVPKRKAAVENALKRSDWQDIKRIVHLMQPQLLDAGMHGLKPLFDEYEAMDGKTPYLKWHSLTKEFIRQVEEKLQESMTEK